MKIYISGKISGTDLIETSKRFAAVAKELQKQGHTTVNPFENGLSEHDPWEDHIAKDIINLINCEGIYMLQGWEDSQGARIEYAVANKLGKAVFYE